MQTYNNNQCAGRCGVLTPQQCVGSQPIRRDCRLNYTSTPDVCYPSTANIDGCSNQISGASCTGVGCYFDPYVQNCFVSQTQFKSVFPCDYFSDRNDGACAAESCVLLADNSCVEAVTTANTADNSTSINFARKILFQNPRVIPNSQTFEVLIGVPFATSATPRDAWPLNPSWPVFQILFPVTSIPNFAMQVNPQCSSQSSSTANPVAINTFNSPNVPALQNYILQGIAQRRNLTFPAGGLGDAANAVYGQPLIGPQYLIANVSQTGNDTTLWFTLRRDLVQLVTQCSQFGATAQVNPTNKVYTIPISYVEHNPQNAFTQFTILYTITITNSGVVTVGTSTNYHEVAAPLQVIFPTATCPANQARMRITWQLELHDVFDPSRVIGPRSISDLSIRSPASQPGPNNCFQDRISNFQFLGCKAESYECDYLIETESNCRQLTTDGNAFNGCSYAQDVDRLLDLGGNFTYNQALDGYHEFFVNNYNCPLNRVNDASCALVTASQFNLPDQVSATIVTSQYLENKITANPFSVETGFLPLPESSLGAISLVTVAPGAAAGLLRYDGNLFSSQPITVVIQLPANIRFTYDLRLNIIAANLTFIPLDNFGVPLSNSTLGRTFADIRTRLKYTTKNDFDAGCGARSECRKLPACLNTLGCDGFSIPAAQLKLLFPANGYRFSLSYAIALSAIGPAASALMAPGLPQAVPSARRLLQQPVAGSSANGQILASLGNQGAVAYDVVFNDAEQQTLDQTLRDQCYASSVEELRLRLGNFSLAASADQGTTISQDDAQQALALVSSIALTAISVASYAAIAAWRASSMSFVRSRSGSTHSH